MTQPSLPSSRRDPINRKRTLAEAIARYVPVGAPSECWLCIAGFRNKHNWHRGFKVNGFHWVAHRAAYTYFIGPIPDGLDVLHRCDIPACCNPAHLFLGTQSDNAKDMWIKERGNPGSPLGQKLGPAWNRQISVEQAHQIFNRYLEGETQRSIANDLGVTDVAISFILRGKHHSELGRTREVEHLLGRARRRT